MKWLILVSMVILCVSNVFSETININTSEQNYSFDLIEVEGIYFSEVSMLIQVTDVVYEFQFSEILYLEFSDQTDAEDNDLIPGFSSILKQNYPNPFNPNTNISFLLEESAEVEIDVYNLKGQKVRALIAGNYGSGEFTVNWNGQNDLGKDEPSGVYFYKMSTGQNSQIKKMILLR